MPDISRDLAEEVRSLFDQVYNLAPQDRAEQLARIENAELRSEVEHLLAFDSNRILAPFLAALPAGMESVSDQLIGAKVSHFEIGARLGSGGMGVVYRARDLKLDRSVALKFLPPELTRNEEAKERFIQEAKAASALDHPHICTIHEIGETDDARTFIAMAYYEGETLQAKIERGALPVTVAIRYARQIADALVAAHAKGIVHRDVKPSNLMVASDGEIKLLDFGLAKLSDVTLTKVGTTLGTVAYMSPEQARGETVDYRTDLWSLGVVLNEMLTHERAFRGEKADAVIHAILHDEPVPVESLRPETPPRICRLVAWLLSKEPAARPASAAEIVAVLDEMAEPPRRRRPPSRRRWTLMGLALSLFIVLSIALIFLRNVDEEELNPNRVVVMPFENRTGDPALEGLGAMAADWITQGLQETGLVDVVPTQEVNAVVSYLADSDTPSGRWMKALGRATGGGLIVAGSCYRPERTIQCQVQIIDATEGKILQALAPLQGNDVTSIVGELRNRVMTALSFRLDPRLASHEGVMDRPPLPEAYDEYVKGIQAYLHRNTGKMNKEEERAMIEHFERAATLDSTFLRAILWLAKAHSVAGDWNRRTELLAQLERERGALNAYDRAHLDFVETVHSDDAEAAYRAARRMMEAAPGSQEAMRETALMAGRTRRYHEALDLLRRLNVVGGPLRNWEDLDVYLAYNLHMLGEHGQELELARRWHASDSTFRPVYAEARALLALGQIEPMYDVLDAAQGRLDVLGFADLLMNVGYELRAHGQDATEVWARAYRAWDKAIGETQDESSYTALYTQLQLAWTLFHQERLAEARDLVADLTDQLPLYERNLGDTHLADYRMMNRGSLNLLRALLLVRSGQLQEVNRILEQRRGSPPAFNNSQDFARMTYDWENAMIAAWSGDLELAMQIYPTALWRDQWDHCRWIEEEPLWGYAPYEALHRPAG